MTVRLLLDVTDEQAARDFAKAHYVEVLDEQLLQGNSVTAAPDLPEDRLNQVLATPEAVASGVVVGLLREGLALAPFAQVVDLQLEHLPGEAPA
jgi:hypothetical protein